MWCSSFTIINFSKRTKKNFTIETKAKGRLQKIEKYKVINREREKVKNFVKKVQFVLHLACNSGVT